MKKFLPIILGAWQAVQDPESVNEFCSVLPKLEELGYTKLVSAIRRILAGERDADALCLELDLEDFMIVETILIAIEDPSTLKSLLPEGGAAE